MPRSILQVQSASCKSPGVLLHLSSTCFSVICLWVINAHILLDFRLIFMRYLINVTLDENDDIVLPPVKRLCSKADSFLKCIKLSSNATIILKRKNIKWSSFYRNKENIRKHNVYYEVIAKRPDKVLIIWQLNCVLKKVGIRCPLSLAQVWFYSHNEIRGATRFQSLKL